MNILIVTPFYKHDKNIASVRWTNLATRLSQKHNIYLVTQPLDQLNGKTSIEQDGKIKTARINQTTFYEYVAARWFGGASGDDWQTKTHDSDLPSEKPQKKSFVRKMKDYLLYKAMFSKAKSYAKTICRDVLPKDEKIDVVISSACPFIEMLFGFELKKRLGCKWISDFRDLPFWADTNEDTHRQKKIMQKCLSVADAVVLIAERGKDVLLDGIVDNPDKIRVITNGFSMTDAMDGKTVDDGYLHLVHTGSLYSGSRKADLLFQAIKLVQEENPTLQFKLDCAGGNNETILATATKYGMQDIVVNHGFIPRVEALKLQNEADCLLALVSYRPGSLAAKLFEYTLCKKPVICITCGENAESDETAYVRALNLGVAVEEVEKDAAVSRLAAYLKMQAERKQNGQELLYEPNQDAVSEYDHDRLVVRYEELCNQIMPL